MILRVCSSLLYSIRFVSSEYKIASSSCSMGCSSGGMLVWVFSLFVFLEFSSVLFLPLIVLLCFFLRRGVGIAVLGVFPFWYALRFYF